MSVNWLLPCRWWWRFATFVVVPLVFGLYSVHLGRDANWDLQNYHWYNPYALLNWRYDIDVAPAFGMSFFSPVGYVPWFLLGTVLPAWMLGFIIGATQSVNLLLLYGLGLVMLPIERRPPREAAALALAGVGMCGGMSLGLLGTTFLDSIVTLGILGSLLAVIGALPVLTAAGGRQAAWRVALAAIPAALAISFKMAVAPFAVGLAAGFLVIEAPLQRRLWLLSWFGVGGALTTALALGPWAVHLWETTGAPFYPFYARAFGSAFAGEAWGFERWQPHGLAEALYYPFVIARHSDRVAEVPFRDFRLAAAYVVVPVALCLRLVRPASARRPLPRGFAYLLVTMLVAYGLWLAMFSYYRYAVALELLAPLAVALAVLAVPFSRPVQAVAIVAILGVVVAQTRPADWGHLPWTERFVEVSVPPIVSPQTATVLLFGQPISYVVPSLPPQAAVIDIEMALWEGGNRQAWAQLIRTRLASRSGAVYAITLTGKEQAMHEAAAPFGLDLDVAGCRPMAANLPSGGLPATVSLSFCPVARARAAGP